MRDQALIALAVQSLQTKEGPAAEPKAVHDIIGHLEANETVVPKQSEPSRAKVKLASTERRASKAPASEPGQAKSGVAIAHMGKPPTAETSAPPPGESIDNKPRPAPIAVTEDHARKLADMVVKAGDGGHGITTSVFDFGGQDVFCLLHPLFLIPYAVYMVCFSLADLLDTATETKALDDLEFWLGSIVVHSRTKSSEGKMYLPPIVLVGTHADHPSLTPVRLVGISDAISRRLRGRAVFELVLPALIGRQGDERVSAIYMLDTSRHLCV